MHETEQVLLVLACSSVFCFLHRIDSLVFRPPNSAAGVKDFQVACVEDNAGWPSAAEQRDGATDASATAVATAALPAAAVAEQKGGGVEKAREGGWLPLAEVCSSDSVADICRGKVETALGGEAVPVSLHYIFEYLPIVLFEFAGSALSLSPAAVSNNRSA